MSLMKAYDVNKSKVTEGIPVEFPEAMNEDGSIPTFYLAYAGGPNKEYRDALAKRTRGFRSNNIPEDIARTILIHVFAETIVKGWKHVQDEDGNEIPHSQDKCRELLTQLPEFFSVVQQRANEITTYLQSEVEETAKN